MLEWLELICIGLWFKDKAGYFWSADLFSVFPWLYDWKTIMIAMADEFYQSPFKAYIYSLWFYFIFYSGF